MLYMMCGCLFSGVYVYSSLLPDLLLSPLGWLKNDRLTIPNRARAGLPSQKSKVIDAHTHIPCCFLACLIRPNPTQTHKSLLYMPP